MLLKDWIEKKKAELLTSKQYRSVEFRDVEKCQITRNMTSKSYGWLAEREVLNQNAEVEELNRLTLGSKEIEAIEVVFDIVKPRKRNPDKLRFYVREIV